MRGWSTSDPSANEVISQSEQFAGEPEKGAAPPPAPVALNQQHPIRTSDHKVAVDQEKSVVPTPSLFVVY